MTVREAQWGDIPALLEIYNYEVLHGCATLDLNPRTLPEREEWFMAHRTPTRFILTAVSDGVPVGYASLSEYRSKEAYRSTAELSVYISPDHRSKGVATELIGEVLRRARECGEIHSVVSVITADNSASKRLHEKFGFRFCGTLHEVGFKMDKYRDIDNYELMIGQE